MIICQIFYLILQRDLIVGGLVHDFMQNKVLFSQLGHSTLGLLPLVLPELDGKRLILRIEQSLSISHLEDLVNGLFFDLLLFVGPFVRHLDLLVSDLVRFVHCHALLHIRLFKRFYPLLFALHHAE